MSEGHNNTRSASPKSSMGWVQTCCWDMNRYCGRAGGRSDVAVAVGENLVGVEAMVKPHPHTRIFMDFQ